MNEVTLKQLRYFEALAEHGHFGRAAAACSVSQPALSVQIKDLETTLGAPLFERGPRQVSLTHLGETFAVRVTAILRAVDELSDLAAARRDRVAGTLRLGVIPTIAPYLLPALLQALAVSHPDLDLRVRETITPRLIAELSAGRLDLAIVALPVSEPSLTEVELFDEDFLLVRPLTQADCPVPDPETLCRERVLLLEEGHCFRDQALAFCGMGAASPRDGLDGSSLATLVQMVGAGIGVTLIPEMAAPVETRSAAVAVARFPTPCPRRTVGVVWRRSSPLAAQFAAFAEEIRACALRLPSAEA